MTIPALQGRKLLTFFVVLSGLTLGTFHSTAYGQCTVSIVQNDTNIDCWDSITLQGILPTGLALSNNFNNGSPGPGWQSTAGIQFNNPCGAHPNGTTYMWMGPGTPAPRSLTTVSLDVSCGGMVCFDLRMELQVNNAPCEGPDLPNEGIFFEYSINNGVTYTQIFYFQPAPGGAAGPYTSWANYCYTIPAAAQTPSTLFRWRQGVSSAANFDHWGLDEITIQNNCGAFSGLWSTGDTSSNLFVPILAADTSYWFAAISGTDTCYDTINIQVDLPELDAITSEDTVCSGAVVQLDTANAAHLVSGVNYQFSWSPASGVSNPNVTEPTATVISTTDYSVTVTHPTEPACLGSDTVRVFDNGLLVIDSMALTNEHCGLAQGGIADGRIELFVSGGTGNYRYDFGNGPVLTPVASNLTQGTYTISIEDTATNCTADTVVTLILEDGLAVSSLTTQDVSCFGFCDGNASVVISGQQGSSVNFDWQGSGQVGNGLSSVNGLCANPAYALQITDSLCTLVQPVSITEPDSLVLSFQMNDSIICINQTTALNAFVTGGTTPYTYQWNVLQSAAGHIVGPDTATNYAVKVVDNNTCETDSQSRTLFVYPPIQTSTIQDTVCPGEQGTVQVVAIGGLGVYQYQWNVAGETSPSMSFTDTTERVFAVTVTDGCAEDEVDVAWIRIHPLPNPRFRVSNDQTCVPFQAQFDYKGGFVGEAIWSFGDGTTLNTTSSRVRHDYTVAGTYPVHLDITSVDGCKLEWDDAVVGFANPTADFSFTPAVLDQVENQLQLQNLSTGASTYEWTFPNGTSGEENPQWAFENLPDGNYAIRLVVTTAEGCVDEITRFIEVEPRGGIWIPSGFTPNNDGINEVFKPVMDAVRADTYEMIIFDRWGQEMFRTKDLEQGWDGGDASIGVYVWTITVETNEGEIINRKGEITLSR
ncbi:MAG: PKD domain-containing protein [Bacteroidota bacterium]